MNYSYENVTTHKSPRPAGRPPLPKGATGDLSARYQLLGLVFIRRVVRLVHELLCGRYSEVLLVSSLTEGIQPC